MVFENHPVVEQLLRVIDRDPLPEKHTSSHWLALGRHVQVGVESGQLMLKGYGFGSYEKGLREWLEGVIGRWSYRDVARRYRYSSDTQSMARRLSLDLGIGYSQDAWRQGVILSVLRDHFEDHGLTPRSFAIIGDGNGFLGGLIRRTIPNARIYSIDLPKMLIFQAQTYLRSDPNSRLSFGVSGDGVSLVVPGDAETLPDQIDCAINTASMAEMKLKNIEDYFKLLRSRSSDGSRFYCVNRLKNTHPDGTVVEFESYPWDSSDEVFVDELCPYWTHYCSISLRRNLPKTPGMWTPFLKPYAGPLIHRLVRLTKN
jgi:hypothetical protein